MAHAKQSHSRPWAYLLQTHEMLFDAMTQAFRVLGGVRRRGISDNMKTAADRISSGKARQVNARFAAMASHYMFEPEFCKVHFERNRYSVRASFANRPVSPRLYLERIAVLAELQITTSRRSSGLSRPRSRRAFPPKFMCSTFCTPWSMARPARWLP